MAVFGAPLPQEDHADRAVRGASAMHPEQAALNGRWAAEGLPDFRLGIGISTGDVAAALLGSDERLEYTLVGDSVNLAQRLRQFAEGGESVLSEATLAALHGVPPDVDALPAQLVKGRRTPVAAFKIHAA